jgi:hypothetical protein
MALKLQRSLDQRQAGQECTFDAAVREVCRNAKLLRQHLGTSRIAREHGWLAAANLVNDRIIDCLRRLEYQAGPAVQLIQPPSSLPRPTLRDLYDEIVQLQSEFPSVTLDLKRSVVAVLTEEIELEGFLFGVFRIELDVAHLARETTSAVFSVSALDPHPATSNESVIHPHVQDGRVCCGDAAVPIATALREGRIADAFLALNAVLNTYNPNSPYVSLEDWHGGRCDDCDTIVSDTYSCHHCDHQFCDDCISQCAVCEDSCCHDCLEEDKVSQRMCCRDCRIICDNCKRLVASDEAGEGLCPGCREKKKEQIQQEKEIKHESNDYPQRKTRRRQGRAGNSSASSPAAAVGTSALDSALGVAEAAAVPARRAHRSRILRR